MRQAPSGGLLHRLHLVVACALLALLHAAPASAITVDKLVYDQEKDQLVMNIVYRGTNPDHEFSVQWSECRRLDEERWQILGLLVDSQPDDLARQDFTRQLTIELKDFDCRPAKVTIRTSAGFFTSVDVPAPPENNAPFSPGSEARNAPR